MLDHDQADETLSIDNGELLASFLFYNQTNSNSSIDRCVMSVNDYVLDEEEAEDDGYMSNGSL